jgi:hypothetical protein
LPPVLILEAVPSYRAWTAPITYCPIPSLCYREYNEKGYDGLGAQVMSMIPRHLAGNMDPVPAEHVLSYIYQNMSILAEDLTRLKTDLSTALARESVQMSPELRRVFSGYILTITKYAAVMTEVSKMLGAVGDIADADGQRNLQQ